MEVTRRWNAATQWPSRRRCVVSWVMRSRRVTIGQCFNKAQRDHDQRSKDADQSVVTTICGVRYRGIPLRDDFNTTPASPKPVLEGIRRAGLFAVRSGPSEYLRPGLSGIEIAF